MSVAIVPKAVANVDKESAIAGARPLAIVPQTLEAVWRLAQLITSAGMAPKGFEKAETCTVAILQGLEVGMTPMAALQSIAVVNGRPTVWGDGAIGLVRGSGLCEWIQEDMEGNGDSLTAVCQAKRKGDPKPAVGRFSVADAKRAGLWDKAGPWKQYPNRMLQMRARGFSLRDGFADVLKGLTLKEEADDGDMRDVTPRDPSGGGAKPPRPPATGGFIASAIEHQSQPVSLQAAKPEGANVPPQPVPSGDPSPRALAVSEFIEHAGYAATIEALDELFEPMVGLMPELGSADRVAIQNAYENAQARIETATSPATPEPERIPDGDPDFQRGEADFRNGIKRCLVGAIKDDPARLAKWQAGWGAAQSQVETTNV
jgi:hypothetical protein